MANPWGQAFSAFGCGIMLAQRSSDLNPLPLPLPPSRTGSSTEEGEASSEVNGFLLPRRESHGSIFRRPALRLDDGTGERG
jgi:hypothetical protein